MSVCALNVLLLNRRTHDCSSSHRLICFHSPFRRKKNAFAPRLTRLALEARILFDGAGAVAGADMVADDFFAQDARPQSGEDDHKPQSPLFDAQGEYIDLSAAEGQPDGAGADPSAEAVSPAGEGEPANAPDAGDASGVNDALSGADQPVGQALGAESGAGAAGGDGNMRLGDSPDDAVGDGDAPEPVAEPVLAGPLGDEVGDGTTGAALAGEDDAFADTAAGGVAGVDSPVGDGTAFTATSGAAPSGDRFSGELDDALPASAPTDEPGATLPGDEPAIQADADFADDAAQGDTVLQTEGGLAFTPMGMMMAPMSGGEPVVPAVSATLPVGVQRVTQEDVPVKPFAGDWALEFGDASDDDVIADLTITVAGGTFSLPGETSLSSYTFEGMTLGEIKAALAACGIIPAMPIWPRWNSILR